MHAGKKTWLGSDRLVIIEREIHNENHIYEAMQFTRELALAHGFSDHLALKLQFAAEEACTNAYEYGLKQPDNTIQFTWKVNEESMEMFVRQTGGNFTLILDEEINYGDRGRGLSLIMHAVDNAEVRKNKDYIELYMKKAKGV